MATVTVAAGSFYRHCCTLYVAGDTFEIDSYLAVKYREFGVFV